MTKSSGFRLNFPLSLLCGTLLAAESSSGIARGDNSGINSVMSIESCLWAGCEMLSVGGGLRGGEDRRWKVESSVGRSPDGLRTVRRPAATGVPDQVSDKESRALTAGIDIGRASSIDDWLCAFSSFGLTCGEPCVSEPPSVIRDISGGFDTPTTEGMDCLALGGF